MANIIPDPKKSKKWRFNKWYNAIETEHDRRYQCVTCGMTFNPAHDTRHQCPFCYSQHSEPANI